MKEWRSRVVEREGFEPSIRFCRIHTFQACAFDHSATAPHACLGRAVPLAADRKVRKAFSACRAGAVRYPGRMTRTFGLPPSLEEIEMLALQALARLPAEFAAHLGAVVVQVDDFADEELLAEMGIEDPFELTGVYEGLPLHLKSIEQSGALPDRIRLFREPILDEWLARGDETLEHLVSHVLIHEVGHHFGLSDEAMHALEEAAG